MVFLDSGPLAPLQKGLEKKGKLFYNIASDFTGVTQLEDEVETDLTDRFERHFIKGHKQAITCVDWMPDNKSLITGSKDCSLIRWDLQSQQKLFFRGEKHNRSHPGHFDEVLCSAISPSGKFLITGGKDRVLRVWDIHNQKQV